MLHPRSSHLSYNNVSPAWKRWCFNCILSLLCFPFRFLACWEEHPFWCIATSKKELFHLIWNRSELLRKTICLHHLKEGIKFLVVLPSVVSSFLREISFCQIRYGVEEKWENLNMGIGWQERKTKCKVAEMRKAQERKCCYNLRFEWNQFQFISLMRF